jgi:hypothetical protein
MYAVFLSLLAGVFLLSAELILRLKGVRPWDMTKVNISVEPGGRFFTRHPTLGYTHIAGRFKVTLADGFSFVVTHLPNSLRITQPIDRYYGASERPEIWIFGCSFTHGWSLNDQETYPWLLQQRLPEYQIVNFGVSGYGTVHSLIQYREALRLKRPRLAILAYASFHDERNTFSRNRRKLVAPWNKLGPLIQPYARLAENKSLQYLYADVEYREFPMMRRLALSHFLEMCWNRIEPKLLRSHEVSEALVMEMARVSKEHNVKFLVAAIAKVDQMLEFAEQHGIPNADISVDLNIKGFINLHDGHPSAAANKLYAANLEAAIRPELSIQAQ